MQILQHFQEFCAQGGSNAAVEGILQAEVTGHHGLDVIDQGSLQLAQVVDLFAGDAVVAGQIICSVGESNRLGFTVGGDGLIDRGNGTLIVVRPLPKRNCKYPLRP